DAVVENLPGPGPSRVILKLNYANVDAGRLTRAYPWDPKYRIFSSAAGTLNGWLEGKLARYDFSGHLDLKSHSAPTDASIVALPLDGSTDYQITPDETHVANTDVRLHSTAIKANGIIQGTRADLKVDVTSTDLKDIAFLYADANGTGSFKGAVSGAIAKP